MVPVQLLFRAWLDPVARSTKAAICFSAPIISASVRPLFDMLLFLRPKSCSELFGKRGAAQMGCLIWVIVTIWNGLLPAGYGAVFRSVSTPVFWSIA